MDVLEGLQQIRGEMDRYVVGHDDVKEAVMLGLIAQDGAQDGDGGCHTSAVKRYASSVIPSHSTPDV